MKYKFKTKPYKHQVRAMKRFIRQKYLGLLWEPGTGKTKAMVDSICALNMMGKVQRAMVVCPLSVTGVWQEEFEMHAPIPYHLGFLETWDEYAFQSCPICFSKERQHYQWRKEGQETRHTCYDCGFDSGWVTLRVLVVNYDRFWRRDEIIDQFNPQLVVADESQRIKKASAKRTWAMRKLHDAPYRAILTGTPTPRSFLDLYGQWLFLNQKAFGTRVQDFKDNFLLYGGFKGHQIRGYRNVHILKAKVKEDASIIRKDQCLDLPEQVYQRVPVRLEPETMRQYNILAEELFLELNKGKVVDAKNAGVMLMRLQQITGGFIKTEDGTIVQMSSAKLKVLKELLEDKYEFGEKVIVFVRFKAEIQAIRRVASQAGYKTVFVMYGKVKKPLRDRQRRAFQKMEGPAVFVIQVQTGGLGITLHAAHEVIFYSVTYALDDYIQACDRVHRSGQTHKVTYRHLVGISTVDIDIYAALRAKKQVMDVLMGHPEKLIKNRPRLGG